MSLEWSPSSSTLPEEDQELLALRQEGATPKGAADHLDVSISKVYSRMKVLVLMLADASAAAHPVARHPTSVLVSTFQAQVPLQHIPPNFRARGGRFVDR